MSEEPEKESSQEKVQETTTSSPPTLRRGTRLTRGRIGVRGTSRFRVGSSLNVPNRVPPRFRRRGIRRRVPGLRYNRVPFPRTRPNIISPFLSGRLFVSGFGFMLSNFELNRIFSPFGKLSRCKIHYDNLGRSRGTANVDFVYPQDARRALRSMNGARIGRFVMKVKFDGTGRGRRRFRGRGFGFRRYTFRRR